MKKDDRAGLHPGQARSRCLVPREDSEDLRHPRNLPHFLGLEIEKPAGGGPGTSRRGSGAGADVVPAGGTVCFERGTKVDGLSSVGGRGAGGSAGPSAKAKQPSGGGTKPRSKANVRTGAGANCGGGVQSNQRWGFDLVHGPCRSVVEVGWGSICIILPVGGVRPASRPRLWAGSAGVSGKKTVRWFIMNPSGQTKVGRDRASQRGPRSGAARGESLARGQRL